MLACPYTSFPNQVAYQYHTATILITEIQSNYFRFKGYSIFDSDF